MSNEKSKGSLRDILQRISWSLENINVAIAQTSKQNSKRQIWKRPSLIIPLIGILLLFIIDFPTESKSKADIVVTEGTEIALIIKPEPNWKALNLPPNPN